MNGALLPAGHPLARRAELRPADLMDELLVMLDPSVSSLLPPIFTALRALGLMGNLETHRHIETVWNLVAAGHGWTVASSTYLATPPPGTVGVRLRGFDVQMHVVARWRAGDRSQLTRNVLDVLRRATDGASRSRRGPPAASHLPWNSAVDAVRNIGMRELKALLAAFEEGSLSDAARRLQLTQSSVSRQIHALEQAFGVMLLEREANGVTATEAGNVVVEDTHTALARFDEALLRARQVDRGFHGVCHVGTVAAELSHNVLVSALRAISQRTPALGIEVEEVLSTQQPGLLRNGRIDIGLAMAFPGLVNDRSIATLRLVDDVFDCAILPASSPLAQQAWVRPDDLRDIPLVFSQRHIFPGFYDAVMRAFEEVGFTPLLEHTHSGPRPVWRMLAGGYGWGLGPRSSRHRPIPGVVAVPIEGFAVPCGLDLLWRRNESDPNVLAVLDAFRNSARVSVAV
jgi:DNA-binding transcriptional LysR family regulator